MGTFWLFSLRLLAVTMISSRCVESSSTPADGGGAGSANAEIITAFAPMQPHSIKRVPFRMPVPLSHFETYCLVSDAKSMTPKKRRSRSSHAAAVDLALQWGGADSAEVSPTE